MRRPAGQGLGLSQLPAVRLGTVRVSSRGGAALQLPLLPAAASPAGALLDQRARTGGTSFHRLPVRSVLNPPASTGMPFWSLNPYVGCEFGCSYCYARDTHRWTVERLETAAADRPETDRSSEPPRPHPSWAPARLAPADAFERRILVKTEVAEVLRRTLDPARVGDAMIMIGTATDPYQPAERRFGITRAVLEVLLLHRGLRLGLITKSSLVTRDLDLLVRLAERHELSVNLSLATADPVLLRRLEPRTPLPHARLRALRALTDAGLDAGILLAPVLPGLTDGWASLAGVMEAARDAGARDVVGFPLRLGPAARHRFLPLLSREFPALAPRYEQHYAGRTNARRDYARALSRRIRTLREAYGFPRPRPVPPQRCGAPSPGPRRVESQPPSDSGGRVTSGSSGAAVRIR